MRNKPSSASSRTLALSVSRRPLLELIHALLGSLLAEEIDEPTWQACMNHLADLITVSPATMPTLAQLLRDLGLLPASSS